MGFGGGDGGGNSCRLLTLRAWTTAKCSVPGKGGLYNAYILFPEKRCMNVYADVSWSGQENLAFVLGRLNKQRNVLASSSGEKLGMTEHPYS